SDEYKNFILTNYPNSIYAEYILNPEFDFITPTTKEALAFYEETYNLFKEDKFEEVKSRTAQAIETYPTEIIIAKFALLNALAIGATEGRENFKSALELVTVAYQNTEEAKKAQEILDLLNGKNNVATKAETDEQKKQEDAERKKEEEKIKEQKSNSGSGQAPNVRPNPPANNAPKTNTPKNNPANTKSRRG